MSPIVEQMHLVTEIDNCRTCGQPIGLQPNVHTWIHLDHHVPEREREVPLSVDLDDAPPITNPEFCCVWHYADGTARILLDADSKPLPGQAVAFQHDQPAGSELCRWCGEPVIQATDRIKRELADDIHGADKDLLWIQRHPPAFMDNFDTPFWLHLKATPGIPTAICWTTRTVLPNSPHKWQGEQPC